jgi:hypothetical protein
MRRVLCLLFAPVAFLLCATAAQAQSRGDQDEAQKACGVAAMTDFTKANLALMQTGTPLMSVQTMIAQRRLEEQYCLRLTRCFISDETDIGFAAEFNSCLSDESLDKYDAVPRDR